MRAKTGILVGALALVCTLAVGAPASAATISQWAGWEDLEGSGGSYTTSVQIAATPAISATVTSDSRGGQVGVISGSSTWLSEGTPVGAKYGSSRGQEYLNLRPKSDTATGSSTTTYSFSRPTPTSGWTFVLGDIDADAARIQAIGPDGQPLTAAQLGFRGGFNYCAPGTVGKPSCTGDAADVPSWDPATQTLTGNAAAADTSGAAAWFEPSAPVASLSIVFTRRAGLPVYQTWFASLAQDVTGVVTGLDDAPATLILTDANGDVIASTTTAPDGTYSFTGVVATTGYTVRVGPPTGKIAVGTPTRTVDLTSADGTADFEVRDIVPAAVFGVVVDDEGRPVSGVTVSIDDQTTTTDADGYYVFDTVEVGPHTVVIEPPTGYSAQVTEQTIDVPEGSEVPIEIEDFVLVENPDLRGSITAVGEGVPGVIVTASLGDDVVTTVTDANGDYVFPRLPAGDYEISIVVPSGYSAMGPISRSESVDAEDVVEVDFALARLGAFDGTVRSDDGTVVPGVGIEVAGPDGTVRLTTDADGLYGLDSLAAGTYTLTVVAPDGTTVVGEHTRTIVITAAGETFVDQDFALSAVVVTPTPSPTPTVSSTPSPVTGEGTLPGTGLGPETFGWAIGGGLVLIVGATPLILARRRRSDRD